MQPLVSPVDHESRHNSYRAEDDRPQPSEDTPLLQRFPQQSGLNGEGTVNTVIISLLLIILLSGVVIGIYLLIIQSDSEHVLPPVDTPLTFVSRSQWDSNGKSPGALSLPPSRAGAVIVVQTDSRPCHSVNNCFRLLREMQANTTDHQLPYHFLVSSGGQTFEALGWLGVSPISVQYSKPALVLAFIGNFTEEAPSRAQLDEAKHFFAESVSLQHLDPSYVILGGRSRYTPKYLFRSLQTFPQWGGEVTL